MRDVFFLRHEVAQEFQKLRLGFPLAFFFQVLNRVCLGREFEMPADFAVLKNAQVVLVAEIRQFSPAQNLAIVGPGDEMVAEAPFVVQMLFQALQCFALATSAPCTAF